MNAKIYDLAERVMKAVRNELNLSYTALSPAIYRMGTEFHEGIGILGTDGEKIYADPMKVCSMFKENPNLLKRTYLHMLFHCIYLHPFFPVKKCYDTEIWNTAVDVCAETAVMRLDRLPALSGDADRADIINRIGRDIKLFVPEPVCKILQSGGYDLEKMSELFHMDDHLWLMSQEGQEGQGGSQSQNSRKNQGRQNSRNRNGQDDQDQSDGQNGQNDQNNRDDQNDGQNGSNDGQNDQNEGQNGRNEGQDDQNEGQDGSNNGGNDQNGNSDSDPNNGQGNGQNGQGSQQRSGRNGQRNRSLEDKKQEWSDVARRIATDLQSFHKQGSGAGNMVQEIDYLTCDKRNYEDFLRDFAVMEEVMKVDIDEFDTNYYSVSLSRPDGLLFIEPLEYKEDKAVREFVIAVDTSGSCSGDLVKKFLSRTYSILKNTESFASRVNIHIIQCDADIQEDTKISSMEEMDEYLLNMKIHGFGGTDFRPVFSYVDDLIHQGEFTNLGGLIYFTDGYGTYPGMPTPYKTAFVFLEDYESIKEVPAWAMTVRWSDDDE